MGFIRKFWFTILILIMIILIILMSRKPEEKVAIQFFPIDKNVSFTDIGSTLAVFKKEDRYRLVGESWGKTSEKVYLRQDINILFRNGMLVKVTYPWKEQTDWLIDKLQVYLEQDSIYTLISFHHAEIHHNEVITSKQEITSDKLYVIYFQADWEAFKEPKNARQKDIQENMNLSFATKRKELFEQGAKELNINQATYEIYDLDTFSLKIEESKLIKPTEFENILGGVWEGLYRDYILGFSEEELKYFSPPMPWILIDKNETHLMILYQRSNGRFEKLLMQL